VRQLPGPPARFPAPTTGLEPLAGPLHVEAEALECGSAGRVGLGEREHDMLGPDGVVLQAEGFDAGPVERPLCTGAKRVRVHPRRRSFRAQRGFASSTSMMGMPSSTG
jgi:hypothetical protein